MATFVELPENWNKLEWFQKQLWVLKGIQAEQGLKTQAQFAKALGVSRAYINLYFRGHHSLTAKFLERILARMEVSSIYVEAAQEIIKGLSGEEIPIPARLVSSTLPRDGSSGRLAADGLSWDQLISLLQIASSIYPQGYVTVVDKEEQRVEVSMVIVLEIFKGGPFQLHEPLRLRIS